MLGRLLNTLSFRLGQELRNWRKSNETIRATAWPWYQKALIAAGKRPVLFPLDILSVVLALSAAIGGYHALTALFSVHPSPPNSDMKERFFALWTVQSAVAAMIYPIVIGFVTLLLQRRHSAKSSLHIYLHDSAAILTGLSALFLVAAMGIQFFFLSLISEQALGYWLLLDSLWFLANILGVIWFLGRTFDYLRPERRADIICAYAINHILPAEIRHNLEAHLFSGAIYYSWLPGPSYGDSEVNSKITILLGSIGSSMGDIQVIQKSGKARMICDVRLRPLSLVVRSWKYREQEVSHSSERQPDFFSGLRQSRVLILPAVPGEPYRKDVGLCRAEGGSGLRWWERWLIRRSFVLCPIDRKSASLRIGDIFNGLITEVQVAMEANEEVAFREALHELVDLHADLIQASDFVNGKNQHDNYTNLAERSDAFGAQMHNQWAREYRRLLEAAVERLTVNDTYFNHMVHVSGWLINRLAAIRPVVISANIIHLSRFLHYRLNRWWSKIGEEQGLYDHSPCKPGVLNVPAVTVYDSAIKQYVGGWEALKNDYFQPVRDEPLVWDGYEEITELYMSHLDDTLYMLFDSISLGNKEGAEWLCDSLIKWWNTIHFRFDNTYYYIRDERNLTLELLRKPWEEAKDVIDLTMIEIDEGNAPKALWSACVHNYWIDLCCVSLYAMLQLGKDCDCARSLPAQLALALGQGKALRSGGSGIGEEWPIQTVEALLIAIIRQYHFDGHYRQGYRARLDKVVEGISSQGKPAMVPGRIYTGWGLDDLEALRDGQLVLLCLFIKEGWSPSARLMETLQKWGEQDDAGLRAFVDQLKQWKTRLSHADFQIYEALFACIHSGFNSATNIQDAIAWLDAGFDLIAGSLEGFRIEQLRKAQVSQDRLTDVAKWCSKRAFNRESADIPASLFRDVRHSAEQYTERSLTIQGINKGEFVEPPMAPRAGNEDEWYARTISSHVAVSVMEDALKKLSPETIDVETALSYWKQIKIVAMRIREQDGTPVLLVASRADPRWLLEWSRSRNDGSSERLEDLRLVREKEIKDEGYVGSLNHIPVYVAPIGPGSSYLISKESLDVLKFTEFEDGVFVQVSVEPVAGKDTWINLRLSWQFQLNLKISECIQLRYIV